MFYLSTKPDYSGVGHSYKLYFILNHAQVHLLTTVAKGNHWTKHPLSLSSRIFSSAKISFLYENLFDQLKTVSKSDIELIDKLSC